MPKKPKSCIFCGRSGVTHEHVVPEWLKQIIRKSKRDGTMFELTHHESGRKTRKVHEGNPITRQVRFVCKPCNTGWLSTLEDEMKPMLTSLIYGDTLVLDHWKQRRLATWAVKTSMTAEFMHPTTAVIPFEIREHLRLNRDPHKDFDVWAGCYTGDGMLLGIEHHASEIFLLRPGTKPASALNTQMTVIGLGRLYLQIAYCRASIARFDYKDQTADFLRRIWPPQGSDLPWPPESTLDAHRIKLLLNGIRNAFKSKTI